MGHGQTIELPEVAVESLNLSRVESYPESCELQVPGQTNELPEVLVEGLY